MVVILCTCKSAPNIQSVAVKFFIVQVVLEPKCISTVEEFPKFALMATEIWSSNKICIRTIGEFFKTAGVANFIFNTICR